MSVQTNTGGKTSRRAKTDHTDTPVKKITLRKNAKATAETAAAPLATKTKRAAASTKAAMPDKAISTKAAAKAASTKLAATATKATAKTSAKIAAPKAPKRMKRGTEGSYTTRTNEVRQAKVVGYEDAPNGAWLIVKNAADGSTNKIRTKAFTPSA